MSQARPSIRTVTAGVGMATPGDLEALLRGAEAARRVGRDFERAGYVVQSLRLATSSLQSLPGGGDPEALLGSIFELDLAAQREGVLLSIGPVDPRSVDVFALWAARLVRDTTVVSFSVPVAGPELGASHESVGLAAEAMQAIAEQTPGGEGNFRFAAAANIPAGTPFFPVAHHGGPEGFALGLELPGVMLAAMEGAAATTALERIASVLGSELERVERLAAEAATTSGLAYGGIDVSPAPGLEASIGAVIEGITGRTFGAAGTMAGCASLTGLLGNLPVQRCGYSGLMLPVLEDVVLAQRAKEGCFGVQELLLYSSVCGTGLDVVPVPGDVGTVALSALIGDVAALSNRWSKPLSARLFPTPGKKAGDRVGFDNPHLTDAVVMGVE